MFLPVMPDYAKICSKRRESMTRMMPRTMATTSRTGIYHTSYVRISAHALFASVLFMVCWPMSKATDTMAATSVIRSIANWIAAAVGLR